MARPATLADVGRATVCMRVHGHTRGELRDAIGAGGASLVEHAGGVVGHATGIASSPMRWRTR
jgi:hypothetical protein